MKTLSALKKEFAAADKRVGKAAERYRKLLSALYMPRNGFDNRLVNVYAELVKSDGSIRQYATQVSWKFYRRGRGGKFYEKPQLGNVKCCDVCSGYCNSFCPNHNGVLVSQDYLDLYKLECAIEDAITARNDAVFAAKEYSVNLYESDCAAVYRQ